MQADKSAEILHILPYHPIAPWDWAAATPDIVLPEDVCTTEDIEWSDKAAYNAVWIVGGAGGRREHIKRAASAADRHAPTVVDPLATDPIATRQRGLRVLADTGRQALIGIKLPVLEETGIILPGSLIQYNEQGQTHIGLSRSVALHWGFPKCRQTVRIGPMSWNPYRRLIALTAGPPTDVGEVLSVEADRGDRRAGVRGANPGARDGDAGRLGLRA